MTLPEWTKDQDARLAELWAEGVPLDEIPKRLGLTGPDSAKDRISVLRDLGRWPEAADMSRKDALRQRGPDKCDVCGGGFANKRALGAHMHYRHKGRTAIAPAPVTPRQEPAVTQITADDPTPVASNPVAAPAPAPVRSTPLRATFLRVEGEVDGVDIVVRLKEATASLHAGRRYRVTITAEEVSA